MPPSSTASATPQTALIRAVHFSAAYAYARADRAPEWNRAAYGRWSSPDGWGCNFRAECEFAGEVDPLTGMIANLADVDAWLKEAVAEFDHRDLRENARLAGRPATADAVARAFAAAVVERMPAGSSARLVRVRLREGANAWTDVPGPKA